MTTPTPIRAALSAEQIAGEAQPLTDEELARIAYKGFDDYWTEDCPGNETEAWAASAKAVLRAALATHPAPMTPNMDQRALEAARRIEGEHGNDNQPQRQARVQLLVLEAMQWAAARAPFPRSTHPAPSAAPAPVSEFEAEAFKRYPEERDWKERSGYVAGRIDAHVAAPPAAQPVAPIPMLLHCPRCGTQHVDAPEPGRLISSGPDAGRARPGWTNPPHRSHLCHHCGCIWRPADVPTTGVKAITTKGKADTWDQGFADRVLGALAAAPSVVEVPQQPEQPLGDAFGPGHPVAGLPTVPIAAGEVQSTQSDIERCKCGYPMPCVRTVPVGFCTRGLSDSTNTEN